MPKHSYRVMIVIRDKFYPFDDEKFPGFAQARRHQFSVAARYPKHDLAIYCTDGRVLAYRDREIEALEKEERDNGRA